jgi:hypothetical protein
MNYKLMIENSQKMAKICLLLASCFLLLASAKPALAQTPQNGITVIPSINHLDLATDPAEYELTYVNNSNFDVNLELSAADFTEFEDSYKINFLDSKDAANYKYSLSSWITFENKSLFLSPGEKKSVKVFIDKNRITKGGHYASILAEIKQPDNNKQIAIKAVISSLLFVRAATGLEVEDGKIVTFEPSRDFFDFPSDFIVRFQNNGNVYVVPYGLIQIYDPLGNKVAQGPFNISSLDALPESIRRYDVSTNDYQKILLPGIYTAKAELHFGNSNKRVSATVKFFSQGMFDFVKITLGLIVTCVILIFIKKRNSPKTN